MKQNKFSKGGKFGKKYQTDALTGYKDFTFDAPSKESKNSDSLTIQGKAFRDLAFSGAIEVKADPNSELAKGSYPYVIINRTNKVADANYAGQPNIAGNSITQIQNSTSSQLMNIFDIANIVKRLNYLYIRSENDGKDNLAYFSEIVKSMEQGISTGYSTMLTQLEFYTDKITTEYPELLNVSASAAGRTGALLHYQSVLQNLVSPLSKYIETRSLEQTLLNMSYRREASTIIQLYGLLKKAAFIAQMNAIGSSVINEYFDTNWYKQMNTLISIPSRRSDGMVDPLLTVTASHKIVNCKFSNDGGDTFYYDSAVQLTTGEGFNYLDPESLTYKTGNLSLEECILNVNKLLDVANILKWARRLTTNNLSAQQPRDPSAYYEAINNYIKKIAVISTVFASYMTSIRTFLDKCANTGLIYWKKGSVIEVSKIADVNPYYNMLVANLFAATYGGSSNMTFDQGTKRWKIFTLWNMYTGIAEFDKISGGAFLTAALRDIDMTDLDQYGSEMLLPILFAAGINTREGGATYNSGEAINRLGYAVDLTNTVFDNNTINNDPYMSRFNPLLQTDLLIKVPNIDISQDSTTTAAQKARLCSSLLHFIATVFGYGYCKVSDSDSHFNTDPDNICFIDVELEDVSNQMIQFARNYSPFRVNTPNTTRTMGFGKGV